MDPQVPVSPMPAQPAYYHEVPQDKHGVTIAAMAVFVLLALGAVAFLYYQNQQLKGLLANYQTAPVSPTPTATPNITANWQTCTNSKLGFSIKYPPNFNFDPSTCNYSISDFSKVQNINVTDAYTDFQKNWLFSIQSFPVNIEPGSWLLANKCGGHITLCSEFIAGPLPNSLQVDLSSHYVESDVVANVNSQIFDFSLNARNPNATVSAGIRNVFNQILSTFQFLGPTSSPAAGLSCTYNGKAYQNGQGFKATDGCNSCSCTNGQVACTLIACPASTPITY